MAFIAGVPTRFGVVAAYWRIGQITVNANDGTITWSFYGYPSKEQRTAGYDAFPRTFDFSESISNIPGPISAANGGELYDTLRAFAYAVTKAALVKDPNHPLYGAKDD